jgi:hypothetical protein
MHLHRFTTNAIFQTLTRPLWEQPIRHMYWLLYIQQEFRDGIYQAYSRDEGNQSIYADPSASVVYHEG